MKFCKLIILVILLSSCHTTKYSLNEYGFTCFWCTDRVCPGGIDGGAGRMEVHFSEITTKGKKIYAKGVVKDIRDSGGVDFCGVYLVDKMTDNEMFLQKQIALTTDSGNFEFKIKLKKEDIIMFYTIGYLSKTFQMQCTTNCPADKEVKTEKMPRISNKHMNSHPPSTRDCKKRQIKLYRKNKQE